jgi:hypothetical protein
MKTAEITKELSMVEKTAPYLTSPSQEAYHTWRPSFNYYKKQHGSKEVLDLMPEDVAIYYGYVFNVQLSTISSTVLLQKLDNHHRIVLDEMAILESNLKMKNSKDYNRSNLENYAKQFIFVLERYPAIQLNLPEPVIVKTFFSKMQPHSFAKDLLKLDLPTIRQAMITFHNRLHVKDIQFSENSKEKQPSMNKKDSENLNKNKNKLPCPNFIAAGRPSGHRIWFCNNIDFCSICQASHMAMGPDCPKRNKDTFDYDQFLSNRKKGTLKVTILQ